MGMMNDADSCLIIILGGLNDNAKDPAQYLTPRKSPLHTHGAHRRVPRKFPGGVAKSLGRRSETLWEKADRAAGTHTVFGFSSS